MTRLFTIPAAAPFLPTLADALLSGRLIPGFPGADPLALTEATLYLPTQRAARAFGRALVAASGKTSLALPRIVPLGAFGAEEGDIDEADGLDAKPAVGDLERRMVLARLVAEWGRVLKGAIRRVGADGRLETDASEPPLVAATPAQALILAGDLAALIDDMRIEGVGFDRLGGLVADAFDPYWKITLDFLKIAFEAWPAWLAERGLADRAERTENAVDREIAALKAGRRGPTIIAGSTGTNRAVARLIGAVARADNGAVVLADLDTQLDEAAWRLIAEATDPTAATHPQAALARLLRRIEIPRGDAKPLAEPGPRAAFLSEAMRPAAATHLWWQAEIDAHAALDGVALIGAEHEAEEALAIALALRETLASPERTAALVTPDPGLARRVAAELGRWGVEVENSAGATLGDTDAGRFARLAVAAAREFSPARVNALLCSPLVRLGRTRPGFARAARALDLGVLRAILPPSGLEDRKRAFAAARAAAKDRHAHPAIHALSDADFAEAEALIADLGDALAPLRDADGGPLGALVEAHRAACEKLAAPEAVGEAVADLFDEWALACGEGLPCSLDDYAAMFETLVAARAPPAPSGHPRLAILGLLEARLLYFDRIVLAGLDESVWPPAARTDAFLNRQMRADLGLSPPERRIGQTAQDFVIALQGRDVIVTRAKKRDGSPTVASRFLRRMEAFAEDGATARALARGARYLEGARWLDRAEIVAPAPRPAPKPPVELRPQRLSVTRIEVLRRDPYAIYAESVLQLLPLPPVGPEIGPAQLGDVWHAALEDFARGASPGETSDQAHVRLEAIAKQKFADLNADHAFRALRWPRIREALNVFLDFDAARREAAETIWIEESGRLEFPLADGSTFTLIARADRIEMSREGLATIIDYKTGAPPGNKEVEVGFAPQMTLEAAMLKRGAFANIGSLETEGAIYLKLGGADGGRIRPVKLETGSFAEVAERHFAEMKALLDQLRSPDVGYLARPFPKFLAKGTDYDHLARIAEWSLNESDET